MDFFRHRLRYRGGDGSSPHPTRDAKRYGDEPPLFLNRAFLGCGAVLLPCVLSGCTRAPTFDIVGSFFPAWLVCLIAGIFLASFAHWLLSRLKITLLVPILVYPSLAALFTFLLWLAFFS